MNGDEDVMTKLEPRCLCCLTEASEKFSTENLTRIVQDLMHNELPLLFKYVPTIFCVDCVASLELYQQFKATVQRSFVSLEKLVVEKGLNKNDYLEQLEIYPRGTPDPNRVRASAKPLKVLWKCPGRPRKDGTAAQPRFFKMKPKTPPVYDSDSDKSNSSDENYCRRSDNEEWNPDNKIVNLNKREKKHKTKTPNSSGIVVKSGKRGRPRKVLLDKIVVKKPEKTHNGILMNNKPTEQFNGNHTKNLLFGKRPRGRPPKTGDTENPVVTVKKNVLQKSFLNESNIPPNDEAPRILVNNSKKRRGRPKKTTLSTNALKLVVTNNNKKLKKCTKPSITIKSILKKKRGRPKKNDLGNLGMAKSNEVVLNRKRKHSQLEKSVGWATETEEEIKIKEESDSESVTTPPSMESRPKNYKSFILAS